MVAFCDLISSLIMRDAMSDISRVFRKENNFGLWMDISGIIKVKTWIEFLSPLPIEVAELAVLIPVRIGLLVFVPE